MVSFLFGSCTDGQKIARLTFCMSFFHRVALSTLILAAVLCPLLLSGPTLLYAFNAKEFPVGLLNILRHVLPWMGGLLILFSSTIAAFPLPVMRRIHLFLFGVAVALYVQGTFLVWNYGSLDGSEIQWNAAWYRPVVDGIVWSGSLLFPFLFSSFLAKHLSSFASCLLILQLAAAGVTVSTTRVALLTPVSQRSESLYSFSSSQNVVLILLDEFQSPAFHSLIDTYPEYREQFRGFTYYQDALASFPTTYPSIPAILSGAEYQNDRKITDFLRESLPSRSIPSVLKGQGWQVDLLTLPFLCPFLQADSCQMLSQVVAADAVGTELHALYELLDLTLFRYSPHFLKSFVFHDQEWLLQRIFRNRLGPTQQVQSIDFIEAFERKGVVMTEVPAFKFIHLMIPHAPARTDSLCRFYKKEERKRRLQGESSYSAHARCALLLTQRIFQVMKKLGVYDRATIFVLGDHGSNEGRYSNIVEPQRFKTRLGRAFPLLLVKPGGGDASSALTISSAPAMIRDVPATLAALLSLPSDFPGTPVHTLSATEARERKYHHYIWKHDFWGEEFLPNLRTFVIRGNSWDLRNWEEKTN
jgi:hypothetical protein